MVEKQAAKLALIGVNQECILRLNGVEITKRVALNNPCNQTPKGQHKTSRHSRNVIAKQQGCQKKNGPPEESGRPLTIACHLKN